MSTNEECKPEPIFLLNLVLQTYSNKGYWTAFIWHLTEDSARLELPPNASHVISENQAWGRRWGKSPSGVGLTYESVCVRVCGGGGSVLSFTDIPGGWFKKGGLTPHSASLFCSQKDVFQLQGDEQFLFIYFPAWLWKSLTGTIFIFAKEMWNILFHMFKTSLSHY